MKRIAFNAIVLAVILTAAGAQRPLGIDILTNWVYNSSSCK